MTRIFYLPLFAALFAVVAAQFGGLLGGNPIATGASSLADVASSTVNLFTKQFGSFKDTFHKTYSSPEEEEKRLGIFSDNQNLINTFNDASKATNSFLLKASEFSDLALDEFNKLINGLRVDRSKSHGEKFEHEESAKIPDRVDLREQGLVTPVRSQGQCASCYAFASAAVLEGHIKKTTGNLVELSPQNIMDCTKEKPYTNSGCSGGNVDSCYDFIKSKGINGETIYPYQTKAGEQCKYQEKESAGNIKGYILLDEGDEKGLEEAIATKGPVGCGIDAHAKSFQLYGGGVYYEPECKSTINAVNHAITVVGYTPEYWICKNSYGPEWGEKGFINISRNVTNHCAILEYCVVPY